ncbi:MAG: HAD family phosphatase [Gammaproteobacteria bacterium]|nr:HAD family phosphatase [Gammaproteobacteria bacterium]
MTIRALIFDMDGTMVDNMHFHHDAWSEWHRRHGLPFDRDDFARRTTGRANIEIFSSLVPGATPGDLYLFAQEKEAIYRELYRPHLRLVAGFESFTDAAVRRGLKLAVATSAMPENISFTLEGLGVAGRFVTVVHPGPGLRGKPQPDLFLEAARRLDVTPAECIVFEDALLGVEAAGRAGMRSVAMTTMLSADEFAEFDNVIATAPNFIDLAVTATGVALCTNGN